MDWLSLQRWANQRGFRAAYGSMRTLKDARADIRQRYDRGELEEKLYRAILRRFVQDTEGDDGSVIIVAVPRKAHHVRFQLEDSALEVILPPTYIDFYRTFDTVREDLAASVLPDYTVKCLEAPLKAVAARLGLIRYGRNNITYAEGLGSYLQLCGYFTDAPADPEQAVHEPRLLDQCAGCERCIVACPTQAIVKDSVLVRAHRCLTYANEDAGPWPEWAIGQPHHCLLGCLFCQRVCPVNPPLRVVDSRVSFTLEETSALLSGVVDARDSVRQLVHEKLGWLDQTSTAPFLGRNLKALIDRWRKGTAAVGGLGDDTGGDVVEVAAELGGDVPVLGPEGVAHDAGRDGP